jgi:hypothetical protein
MVDSRSSQFQRKFLEIDLSRYLGRVSEIEEGRDEFMLKREAIFQVAEAQGGGVTSCKLPRWLELSQAQVFMHIETHVLSQLKMTFTVASAILTSVFPCY